jgi:AraC family transcriptional regulator of adaptative response / DNA-3-methyladenine glycosylase II
MFVTAVTTTRIYCRPSCPAMTPKRDNVVFYPTPAAAQEAGFRACKRCRPDAAPGSPEWDRRGDAVARVVRMIGDGVIERDGVSGLARRVGYSPRHLHRMMVAELGTGPLQLSLAHRVSSARALLETTSLSVTDVAMASGFGSVRQFNDLFRRVYGCAPGELRRRGEDGAGLPSSPNSSDTPIRHTITARLSFRPPLDVAALLDFLGRRAVPGVEHYGEDGYSRVVRLPRALGIVSIAPSGGANKARLAAPPTLTCRLELDDVRDYPAAVARVRRMLDLDADPNAVAAALGLDPWIRPFVEQRPGLRLAGTMDGAELALRAVLGQQVSVASARSVAGRLAASLGDPLPGGNGPLRYTFPTPSRLAEADWTGLPLPRDRALTLQALARAIRDKEVDLEAGADREESTAALESIRGIGPWTSGYVRMRALGDPDVFLEGDAGVRRALAARRERGNPGADGHPDPEKWRPWASYAVAHLWASAPEPASQGTGRGLRDVTPGALPAGAHNQRPLRQEMHR